MLRTCFICPPQNRGWILHKFCREIQKRIKGESLIVFRYENLPKAESYYLAHYSLVPLIEKNGLDPSKCVIVFTHPTVDVLPFIDVFNKSRKVICGNDTYESYLIGKGVKEGQVMFLPECSDPQMFSPRPRTGNGGILISGAYYPRKNPELLLQIIDASPEYFFHVVGTRWEKWKRFGELKGKKNVAVYLNLPYDEYPQIYSYCSTFLSTSTMEGGGPNALIEAMMCNMVPVVTDTGNARQYILNKHNGFILPISATTSDFKSAIDSSRSIETDVSLTVREYTWENYAQNVIEYLLPDQALILETNIK